VRAGVGAEVKVRTYFTRSWGLFANDDFGASPIERQRRGKSADPN
jgi:hypothetical protein